MPEEQYLLTQEQKLTKPQFEDVAADFLGGDVLTNALDFVAFLRKNKLKLVWRATNSWNAEHKGERVCSFHMSYDPYAPSAGNETFTVRPWGGYGGEYENFITSDTQKDVMWSSVKRCTACNGRYIGKKRPCNFAKGNDIVIFGKEFKSVCGYLLIENPGDDALDFAKSWVEAKLQTLSSAG